VPCYGCSRELPLTLLHEHHPHPQAAGGANLGTVYVCPTCHASCHAAARCVQRGQENGARDVLAAAVDQDPAAVERLLVLVRTEVKAWAHPSARARQPVAVDFPRETYSRLSAIARGIMSKNGRTIGVPKLVRAIVDAWLRKELAPKSEAAPEVQPPRPELKP